MGGGLAAGLLLGAYWALASRRNKANNMQIRQDDTRQNSKLNYLIIDTFLEKKWGNVLEIEIFRLGGFVLVNNTAFLSVVKIFVFLL